MTLKKSLKNSKHLQNSDIKKNTTNNNTNTYYVHGEGWIDMWSNSTSHRVPGSVGEGQITKKAHIKAGFLKAVTS